MPKPDSVPGRKRTKSPPKATDDTVKRPSRRSKDAELKEGPREVGPHNHSLTAEGVASKIKRSPSPAERGDQLYYEGAAELQSEDVGGGSYGSPGKRETQGCDVFSLNAAASTGEAAELDAFGLRQEAGNGKAAESGDLMSEEEKLAFEKLKNETLREFQTFCSTVVQKAYENPALFVPALEQLVRSFEGCDSPSSLLSRLLQIGENCEEWEEGEEEDEENLPSGRATPPARPRRRAAHRGGKGRGPTTTIAEEEEEASSENTSGLRLRI